MLHRLCSRLSKTAFSSPTKKHSLESFSFISGTLANLESCVASLKGNSLSVSLTWQGNFVGQASLLTSVFGGQKKINNLSSFFQRGEIFKIKSIDAFVKPELYKLEDLLGTEIKGNFYAKQLRLAPNGDDPDFVFEVEAILKKRKVRGVEEILVKYLYYPGKKKTSKFDRLNLIG